MSDAGPAVEVDLDSLPIVDNHCHSLLRDALQLDALGFRGCFTESGEIRVLRDHLPHSLFYRQ